VTDAQTDRQTEFSSLYRVCISCSMVKTSRMLVRVVIYFVYIDYRVTVFRFYKC